VDQLNPQAFLEACGVRTPLQLDVEHRQRQEIERRILPLPFALIGRNKRADLRLDDEGVDDRHAYLQMVDGRWWWVHLQGRTGSLSKVDVSAAWKLLDHQGISIGPYTIRPVYEGSPDETGLSSQFSPLPSDADNSPSQARLCLELFSDNTRQRTWMVDRPLTLVGRASFCKLRLHSAMVSRAHCALVNTPAGLWVVDLLSRKGISVNRAAVRWARLEPGDELQICPFLIRTQLLDPSTQPSSTETAARSAANERGLTQRESERREPLSLSAIFHPVSSTVNSPAQAIISSQTALPVGTIESMLSPLMVQFSLMQQQMFEQFQQTVLMIGQMFGNLHREQIEFVRQELAQIQRLTRELQTLQEEWSTRPPSPQPALPPSPGESPTKAPPVKPAAAAGPTSTAPPPPAEIHTWLSQRLTEINQERQGRWQKILGVLTGK
jgi:pSer/pThr/pTyr-binding forkhead associated (FHA) protein